MSQDELERFEKLCTDVEWATPYANAPDELKDRRGRILDDDLFEILPLLATVADHTQIPTSQAPSFTSSPTLEGQSTSAKASSLTHEKLVKVAELLGCHASPRELVLAVGEGLERAIADVEDCYLFDEDEDENTDDDDEEEGPEVKGDLALANLNLEDDEEEEARNVGDAGAVNGNKASLDGKNRTTLDGLIRRVLLCLEVLSRALVNPSARKPPSEPVRSILLTLGEFVQQVYTAVNADASYSISGLSGLIIGTARFCTIVWESGTVKPKLRNKDDLALEAGGEETKDELEAVVIRPMGQAVVLLHSKLKWEALDRWFTLYSGELSGMGGSYAASDYDRFKEEDDARPGVEAEVGNAIKTALAAFGYGTTLQLVQLVTHRLTGFLPHTALILLTSPSQVQVTARYLNADTSRNPNCTDQEEEEIRIKALKEQKSIMLDQSTAALGSATQGLAVDAGCTWIWLMVDTIRMDRQWYGNVRDIWLEEETAEMVIEWIMPIVIQNPGSPRQFALERLLSRIPRLVGSPEGWARLCDRIISEMNFFVEARTIGLKIVSEDLSKIIRMDQKEYRKSFWTTLAPTIFGLPTTEPDIRTATVLEIADSIYPEWIVGSTNMLYHFSRKDAEDIARDNERARKHMDEEARTRLNETARINREEDRQGVDVEGWSKDLKDLISKWEREVEGKSSAFDVSCEDIISSSRRPIQLTIDLAASGVLVEEKQDDKVTSISVSGNDKPPGLREMVVWLREAVFWAEKLLGGTR